MLIRAHYVQELQLTAQDAQTLMPVIIFSYNLLITHVAPHVPLSTSKSLILNASYVAQDMETGIR